MFEKELIIDGRGHLEGRLASIVAKELLSGQRVTVVGCEQILKSGSLKRNHIIREDIMKKRINTNPRRGAKHWKAPSRIFWKARRNFCTLGELATITGWTKEGVVADLETKRKAKSEAWYAAKQKKADARTKAAQDKTVAPFNAELAKLGF